MQALRPGLHKGETEAAERHDLHTRKMKALRRQGPTRVHGERIQKGSPGQHRESVPSRAPDTYHDHRYAPGRKGGMWETQQRGAQPEACACGRPQSGVATNTEHSIEDWNC